MNNGKSFDYGILGTGKIMQGHALNLIKYVEANPSRKMSITKLSEGTGIPRMNIYWLIQDASIRETDSVLGVVAKENNFNVVIDDSWNRANKYARTKPILKAKKVTAKSHTPHVRLKEKL